MTLTARASRAVRSVEPVTDAAIAVANPCQIRISSLNLLDFTIISMMVVLCSALPWV
ncbi:MAG: hypothetical protein ACFB12_06570 [Leptolyngbyaceae cyanobacterium]